MSFLTSGIAGAALDKPSTVKSHDLGTISHGDSNSIWIYCLASGTVATGTCTVNATTFVLTDTAGGYTADVAFADGEYGWVHDTTPPTA